MGPKAFRQRLAALQQRLAAGLDNLLQARAPATLHELRIALRRLRTLLRPLRRRRAVQALYALAGQVLAATSPLRDLEVLAIDLEAHRRPRAAARRRRQLQETLLALVANPALRELQAGCSRKCLLLPASALPDRAALKKRRAKTLQRDRDNLQAQLARKNADLHRLRLAIKRLRYQLEDEERPPALLSALTAAQATLGDWHDREIWLEKSEAEDDLRSSRARWRREHGQLAALLPELLGRLALELAESQA